MDPIFRWNNDQQKGNSNEQEGIASNIYGFGSISRRQMRKPIIAAVSGGAFGGGMEMLLNCDIVIAAQDAKFAMPEVKRGVIAIQGGVHSISERDLYFYFYIVLKVDVDLSLTGIPRLSQIAGHHVRHISCLASNVNREKQRRKLIIFYENS